MPPDRRTRNSAIVRVRWQRRTAAIPFGIVQAVIEQAAYHFRLNDIIDELVLVSVIDDEELELTSTTLKLLPKDAVVVLTCIAQPELGDLAQKSASPTLPSIPARRPDRPPELPARPLKARSPSPSNGFCKCGVCVRATRQRNAAPESAPLPDPPRYAGGTGNVKAEALDDETITFSVAFPNHPSCTVTVPPSVTGQDVLAAVAPRWTHNKYDFALYSVGGHRISPNLSLFENGIRNGDALGLRGGGNQPIPAGPPHWHTRVAGVPYGVTLLRLDGKYRDVPLRP